jgi:hypothetical protein
MCVECASYSVLGREEHFQLPKVSHFYHDDEISLKASPKSDSQNTFLGYFLARLISLCSAYDRLPFHGFLFLFLHADSNLRESNAEMNRNLKGVGRLLHLTRNG